MIGGRGDPGRLFHRDFGLAVMGVGVGGIGRVRGCWPRGSRSGALETVSDAAEQLGFGARRDRATAAGIPASSGGRNRPAASRHPLHPLGVP